MTHSCVIITTHFDSAWEEADGEDPWEVVAGGTRVVDSAWGSQGSSGGGSESDWWRSLGGGGFEHLSTRYPSTLLLDASMYF